MTNPETNTYSRLRYDCCYRASSPKSKIACDLTEDAVEQTPVEHQTRRKELKLGEKLVFPALFIHLLYQCATGCSVIVYVALVYVS
jgi:hypothetical protein